MKKIYLTFSILLVIGIASGIYYFTEFRQSKMEFPENVVMESHKGSDYVFKQMEPKVRLLEFIYTSCPDICPNTTFQMEDVRDRLAEEGVIGKQVEFLTVTIDPANDTLDKIKDYANTFHMDKTDGWYVLRGSKQDTRELTKQFNFQYRKSGTEDFVHTSATYLLNADNRVVEIFGMGDKSFDKEKVFKEIMKEVKKSL